MKQRIAALLIIAVLTLTACTTNTITVTHDDTTTNVQAKGEIVALTGLLPELTNPDQYVYTLKGDRTSTVTYDEFSQGQLNTEDNSLVFDTIMCDCAGITGLQEIIIEDKITIRKGEEAFIVKGELKTYIENYLTTTPTVYEYYINEESFSFEDLTEAPEIVMRLPTNALELKLRGDNPSAAYADMNLKAAVQQYTTTPTAYTYTYNEEATDWNKKNLTTGTVIIARNTITLQQGEQTNIMQLSTTANTELAGFITDENKTMYEYKLVSAGGFSPPPLSWEDFSTGVWDVDNQVTVFDVPSKKYRVRDLATIDVITLTTTAAEAIMINELLTSVERTEYEGEQAIVLSEFIKDIENPETKTYQLVATDGYSPEAFTYEDLKQGYWLLESKHTLFPHKNVGKNRIRDLEKIIPQ
ncbi:hypothetical protein GF367_01975 [Candidatus Woesearchaeota archaeon]|nr:hypothetical protein [Candidatus Woesearchaeota archaeon]